MAFGIWKREPSHFRWSSAWWGGSSQAFWRMVFAFHHILKRKCISRGHQKHHGCRVYLLHSKLEVLQLDRRIGASKGSRCRGKCGKIYLMWHFRVKWEYEGFRQTFSTVPLVLSAESLGPYTRWWQLCNRPSHPITQVMRLIVCIVFSTINPFCKGSFLCLS